MRLLLVLFAAGCIGSPQPDPPNLDDIEVEVNGDRLDVRGRLTGVTATLSGLEVAWSVNLDDGSAPRTVRVVAHEFEIVGAGAVGQELRIQIRDDRWSPPLDVLLVDPPRAGPRPLADCFLVDPPLELELGLVPSAGASVERAVEIRNDCAESVDVEASVRAGTSFSIVDAPLRLAEGTSGRVLIRYTSIALERAEEIVFIRARTPSVTDRRPITVYAN
jgi:hypothetical protein